MSRVFWNWTDETVNEYLKWLDTKPPLSRKPLMEQFKEEHTKPKVEWEIIERCPIEGTIYSVKRLSDGEVFKLREEVEAKRWGRQIIESFDELSGGGLVNFATCRNPITDLKKATKPIPLFKTEDGVDVYDENYRAYGVNTKGTWEINSMLAKAMIYPFSGSWKWFSSEEKREEYILLHKPLLSVNDVMIYKGFILGSSTEQELKRLAKEKLSK
jgi:hypothetical protein